MHIILCIVLQNLNRTSTIKGSNGQNYLFVDVISLLLKEIVMLVQAYFEARYHTLPSYNVILTVPTLWGTNILGVIHLIAQEVGYFERM